MFLPVNWVKAAQARPQHYGGRAVCTEGSSTWRLVQAGIMPALTCNRLNSAICKFYLWHLHLPWLVVLATCPLLPATFGPLRHGEPAAARPADGHPLRQLRDLHFRRRPSRAPTAGVRPEGAWVAALARLADSCPLRRERSMWATLGSSRFLCPRAPLS